MRRLLRAIVTVLVVGGALAVLPASAATAAPGGCDGTHYATDGSELFTVEQKYLPLPLRTFPPDCASRAAGDDFTSAPISYALIYADVSWGEFVDITKQFELDGYGGGRALLTSIDDDPANSVNRKVKLTSADLLALDPATVDFVHGSFSDPTGAQDVTLYYTDGDEYQVDGNLTTPSLEVTVVLAGAVGRSTALADPSVLSSLRTITEALPNPTQLGVLGAGSVMLMLIVGYPGLLLEKVIDERYDEFAERVRRRFRRGEKNAKIRAADVAAESEGNVSKPAGRILRWLIWPGFVLAAAISGFVDPAFGVNPMSARVLVTGLIGFVVFNLGGWALVTLVLKRLQPEAQPWVRFRWGSLVLLALAVLLARALEFHPGVIFGLVSGLAFSIPLALSRNAVKVLLGAGFGLAIALLSWVGYSLLSPVAASAPGNVPLVFGTEFLSGLTIQGISSLPLALLPLAVLDGSALLRWKKWVWGIAYTIGVAAFMLVVFTIPDSFGSVSGDFVRWVLLFVAFGALAIAVWAIDRAAKRRAAHRMHAPIADP